EQRVKRHQRRKTAVITRIETKLTPEMAEDFLARLMCGWSGCTRSLDRQDDPAGWVALVCYEQQQKPALHVSEIKQWRHDKVLCPEHAEALDALLEPGTGVAAPAIMAAQPEGSA